MLVPFIFINLPQCLPCLTVVGKLALLVFMSKVANKSSNGQNDQNFHH